MIYIVFVFLRLISLNKMASVSVYVVAEGRISFLFKD